MSIGLCSAEQKYDPAVQCAIVPSWVLTVGLGPTRHACGLHLHSVAKRLLAATRTAEIHIKPYEGE